MSSRMVSTAKELKQAITDKVDEIIITDRTLAAVASTIFYMSIKKLTVLASLVAAGGLVATNPAGLVAGGTGVAGIGFAALASGATAGVAGGTGTVVISVVITLAVLGIVVFALHKDYEVDIKSKADAKKMKGNFNLKLNRKSKSNA